MTDKPQHGGKRPGAGRKFAHGEPTTSVQIRVPNSLLARIDNEAASKDISRNQIIIEVLQASHRTYAEMQDAHNKSINK